MTPRPGVRLHALRLAGALLLAPVLLLAAPRGHARKPSPAGDASLEGLERRYAALLLAHRPDLAVRYGARADNEHEERPFIALDESSIAGYVASLRAIRADAAALAASTRADSLGVRLDREIADCAPGGGLRSDPALWLDIVEAAVRGSIADSTTGACERARRATQALRRIPEALRGATVLMRGAPEPDATALESRLTEVERFFRADVPVRTEACKESRRRAELVEADSLAAASLAQFRRWVSWHG